MEALVDDSEMCPCYGVKVKEGDFYDAPPLYGNLQPISLALARNGNTHWSYRVLFVYNDTQLSGFGPPTLVPSPCSTSIT